MIVPYLIGHPPIDELDILGQLIVVVLLVPERSEEIPQRLPVVAPVRPEVVTDSNVEVLWPTQTKDFLPTPLQCYHNGGVVVLFIDPIGDVL